MGQRETKSQEVNFDFFSGVYADTSTSNLTNATLEVFKGAGEIRKLGVQWKNVDPEITQGRMFEALEVMKFNRAAATQGAQVRATATASLEGMQTADADILISRGKTVLKEVQAKSCKTAGRSLFQVSEPKYDGMDRLVPKGQGERAKELADKRIATGTLKADDYRQAKPHIKEELSHGKVTSGGTTREEAVDAAVNSGRVATKHSMSALATEMHGAGMQGGYIGGGLAGGMSAARGIHKLINREGEIGAVIAEITVDTAKGFATGYATSALTKGLGHGFQRAGLGAVAKYNAHAAVAAGVVQSAQSIGKYLRGEIESEQMLDEISHTAITGSSAFYYGAVGQAVIPIPVVGALVGSTVGYFVGSILYKAGIISLGDTQEVKMAKQRRAEVEAICLQAIPMMQRHREELEALINEYLRSQEEMFKRAFSGMESALLEWDPDAFTAQLNTICESFETGLPFKNFAEFDDFMRDSDADFVF
ncbi:hypothetical protein [Thioalkalivibrio sp.]|uniref:hypothetical protein n=1 Tax=Thioalkalivibrio sp. TaxID=2093813 RepID=UPI003565CED2